MIIAGMWGFGSVPLVHRGFKIGFQKNSIEFPTTTFESARAIPPPSSACWKTPVLSMIITGVIPFAAIYVETFFSMICLWKNEFFYTPGFSLIVFINVLVTCADVTILCVYFRLNAENHNWWWQAFFWSGSIGFFILLYSIVWFWNLDAASIPLTYMLYFGYMLLISFGAFLLFGSVGFIATLLNLRRMYSVVNQSQGGYVELLDSPDSPEDHDLLLSRGKNFGS